MSTVDKRTSASSHLSSLDPVVAELQLCPATRVTQMEQLIISGRVNYLDSAAEVVARRFGNYYSALSTNTSTVPNLKLSKAPRNMSPQRLLQKDDSWVDEAQFHPLMGPPLYLPLNDERGIEKAARESVGSLDDVYNMRYASTLTLRCTTLDQYLKPLVTALHGKSALPQALTSITSIMHCGALLSLEASALVGNSEIHLLTGYISSLASESTSCTHPPLTT